VDASAPPVSDPGLAASSALAAAATYSTVGDDAIPADAPAGEGAAPNGETGDRAPRERRSRDRYGRDRRERGPRDGDDRTRRDPDAPQGSDEGAAPADTDARSNAAPAHEGSYFAQRAMQQASTQNGTPDAAPARASIEQPAASAEFESRDPSEAPGFVDTQPEAPVVPAAAFVTAAEPPVVPAASAAPAAAPASTPRALPVAQPFELPVASLAAVAESSGLQWVNSDASKIAAVQAAIAAEPQPIRVPRERPPAVSTDAGPLVLVETKRDLRNLTLPFEENGPK
jgi:ribonuclease E